MRFSHTHLCTLNCLIAQETFPNSFFSGTTHPAQTPTSTSSPQNGLGSVGSHLQTPGQGGGHRVSREALHVTSRPQGSGGRGRRKRLSPMKTNPTWRLSPWQKLLRGKHPSCRPCRTLSCAQNPEVGESTSLPPTTLCPRCDWTGHSYHQGIQDPV